MVLILIPQKVTSLDEDYVPKNKDELRSLLAMTNKVCVCSVFVKNYSSITADLRKLLHKHFKWGCNDKHQNDKQLLFLLNTVRMKIKRVVAYASTVKPV